MASAGGWTYKVALNELRRILRRRGRANAAAPRDDVVPSTDPELWDLVRRLPERQRTAIVLRYVADLPERSVAEAMGIRRSTVASTLTQARHRLADWMREAELDTEVGHA
jgi:RNA polymerase sigma-70 factor (ECF subfamily)